MSGEQRVQHLLRDASPETLQRLEAVCDLKSTNLLGTGEAYRWIKDNAAFTDLRAQAEELAGVRGNLTVSEVKVFCETLREFAQHSLAMIAAMRSTTEDWSVFTEHAIIPFRGQFDPRSLGPGHFAWEIDYRLVLAHAITLQSELSLTGLHQVLFPAALQRCHDEPLLHSLTGGERISFADFERSAEHRKWREQCQSFGLCYESAREEAGLAPDAPAEKVHEAAHRMRAASERREVEQVLDDELPSQAGRDIRALHNFDALYERAEREYTLRTLEVERRLAIAAVFARSDSSLSGAERVDQALENSQRIAARAARNLEGPQAASFLTDLYRRSLEKHSYESEVIRRHRPFLTQYFR